MATTTIYNELIAVNAVSGTAIADNAVTSVHIAQNNVGTVQLALNSVTSVSIALNQVTGTQIANNAITSTQLADNAVTATKVPDGTQFTLGATTLTGALTGTTGAFVKASSGGSATAGTVVTIEDDDNTELSILGGSSSLLAINFGHSGDVDDGMITYNTTSGSEAMNFTVDGGVDALYLSAGDVVFNNGSVDMNFRVESNGNANMLFVDAGNDRVGIGAASPSYPLSVEVDASATWLSRFYNTGTTESDNGLLVRTGSEHDGTITLGAYSGSSYKFVVLGDGNVGIGTTSPTSYSAYADNLVVAGAGETGITIASGNSSQSGLYFSDGTSGTEQYIGFLDYNHSSNALIVGTNGAERIRLTSDGDLGIGQTPIANSRLTVKTQGDGTFPIRVVNSADTDLLFGVYESSDGDGNNGMLYLNDGGGTTDVKLSTNGDSWFNGGKLAIGADHADEPLTVRSSGENVNTYLIEIGNDLHATNTKDAWMKYVGGAATTDHSWATGIYSDRFKIVRLGARGTAPDSGTNIMEFASTGTAHLGQTASDMRLYLGSQGGAFGANSTNNLRPVGTAFYQNSGGGNFVFERAGTGVGYIDSGGFNDGSDEALKKNIADLTYGLDTVKSLKPRKFKWKSNSEDAIGFIAQEVESIVPEIVSESNPEGTLTSFKGLSYGHLTAVLVKAVQELEARVKELEG